MNTVFFYRSKRSYRRHFAIRKSEVFIVFQVNGIPLDGATFEEFFIYLKCYAQTYLTIEVEACPDLFRIAADMNERDNFCIRVSVYLLCC